MCQITMVRTDRDFKGGQSGGDTGEGAIAAPIQRKKDHPSMTKIGKNILNQ
jgi:hypothetical protein